MRGLSNRPQDLTPYVASHHTTIVLNTTPTILASTSVTYLDRHGAIRTQHLHHHFLLSIALVHFVYYSIASLVFGIVPQTYSVDRGFLSFV